MQVQCSPFITLFGVSIAAIQLEACLLDNECETVNLDLIYSVFKRINLGSAGQGLSKHYFGLAITCKHVRKVCFLQGIRGVLRRTFK